MHSTTKKSFSEQLLDIKEMFLTNGGTHPIDLDALARFAINGGHWKRPSSVMIQLCKRDFARSMREQYHTDPQGRQVRTFHAVKTTVAGIQQVFWDDMREAPTGHMQLALQQRRNQIVGDCVQLKRDVDSYNDNNTFGENVQMEFNFIYDIAEREQPGDKYRPKKPK